LPPNFEPHQDEATAIGALLDSRSIRKIARNEYTDEQWRMHHWAYCRLTAMADAQIQDVLDAMKQLGQEENTLVR
jgi:arylsulfatase A-like enzyme